MIFFVSICNQKYVTLSNLNRKSLFEKKLAGECTVEILFLIAFIKIFLLFRIFLSCLLVCYYAYFTFLAV